MDITLTARETVAFESNETVMEVTSGLNWWLVAVQDLDTSTKPGSMEKIHHLLIAGGSGGIFSGDVG